MRIIGGEYRSRLISMPKGADIRPTQDKVRQAIFNLLKDVGGMRVLELFAGSGALGIEAISRGASHVTFVDNNPRCIATIKANLESLNINIDRYKIMKGNALTILPRLAREAERFDLIMMDPPYYKDIAKICLINVSSYDILSRIGIVMVERFRKDELPPGLETLKLEKERAYGDTVIAIFRKIL